MRHTYLLLKNRVKIANNYVAGIRDHLLIHLFVFIGVVCFLILGGTVFFYHIFSFLNRQEEFGTLLMDRLIGMVMMAFFSMLIFSNLIITLSTTYISREIEYFMGQPVQHRSIFFVKLAESIVYSSWAFAILSLPFFISFGLVRGVSLWFYPLVILLIIPFLIVPAGIGALITMLISAFLPARRALKWTFGFVAVGITASIVLVRLTGIRSALFSGNVESYTQILTLLKVGQNFWSPHFWITRGMIALAENNWKEYFYWLALITSTSLMLLQVCAWLAPALYYRGWCLANETAGSRNGHFSIGRIIFDTIERLFSFLRPPVRALVMKDIKTFWRDPAQWSQLIILFGLLFIYMANLRSAYFQSFTVRRFIPFWMSVIAFFNMGTTCFILSIITSRFVYPMLSLEGKQYWIVGLAPMKRSRVVWEKYWLCWISSLIITEALMVFSNWILRVTPSMMLLSTITLFFMSFGLTSLSVGLGAATPNFKEDNPARIANGLGGTLNVIISLVYIGSIIAVEVYPAFLTIRGNMPQGHRSTLILGGCILAALLIHAATIIIPMRIGLKRWREMEF